MNEPAQRRRYSRRRRGNAVERRRRRFEQYMRSHRARQRDVAAANREGMGFYGL